MKKLFNEIYFFGQQPREMRILLMTNLLYALVLPIVEIFVGAYIMRNTGSPSMVALYQLLMYVGIIATSVINGSLLKWFKIGHLYSMGILLSGLSMAVMMFIESLGVVELSIAGFLMGAASGFFWTNRYLLALNSTNDDNRNYFFGLETFFFSLSSIVVPLMVGAFLSSIEGVHLGSVVMNVNWGYRVITGVVFLITIMACITLSRGKFNNPNQKDFFYLKFHPLWNKLLSLAALKGLVQGFLVTAPAILVMRLIGDEGSLGLIQGISGFLTAILVYVLGRLAKPNHRIAIFTVGLIVFLIGTVFNGLLFSAIGVIVFILCKVLFQPLHDLAYFPIMMKTIDVVSVKENRNAYAYILSHELGLFVGRALGLILFILLATYVSEEFSLKYALIIVSVLQLLSYPLSRNIVSQTKIVENEIN